MSKKERETMSSSKRLLWNIGTILVVLAACAMAADNSAALEIDESSMSAWTEPGTGPDNMKLGFQFSVPGVAQGVSCTSYPFSIDYRELGASTWITAVCTVLTPGYDVCSCVQGGNPPAGTRTYRTYVTVSIGDPCVTKKYEWRAWSMANNGVPTSVKNFKALCITE
jgi:hypothetical protein